MSNTNTATPTLAAIADKNLFADFKYVSQFEINDIAYAAIEFAKVTRENKENEIEQGEYDLDDDAKEAAEEYADAEGDEYKADREDIVAIYKIAYKNYIESTGWYEEYQNQQSEDLDDQPY